MTDKEFNATPEGQRAMFYRSHDVASVLVINRTVRRLKGSAWEDSVIEKADSSFLSTIREDLIEEYNRLMMPAKCVHCGKPEGLHHPETKACVMGIDYSHNLTFTQP